MADDDLEALKARGRIEAQKKAEVHAQIEAREAKERERRRIGNRDYALTLWGLFTGDMRWFYAFVLFGVPLAVINIVGLVYLKVPEIVFMLLVPGHGRLFLPIPALLLTLFLLLYVAPRMCRRALERERAWIASLPFVVTGYEKCLGDSYSDNQSLVSLHCVFVDRVAPGLAEILAADGGTWTVNHGKATRKDGIRSEWREDNNRKVVRWFHKLVQEQLLPVHARFPIKSVRLANRDDE